VQTTGMKCCWKGLTLESGIPGLRSHCTHLLAVCPEASHFPSGELVSSLYNRHNRVIVKVE
jgi:hypothetical protein